MPLSTRLQAEVKVLMTPSAAPAWCTLARSRYRPSPAHKPCINSLNSVLQHIQNCCCFKSYWPPWEPPCVAPAAAAGPGCWCPTWRWSPSPTHTNIFHTYQIFFLFSPAPETPSCCHGRNCALGPASPLPPHPGQCLHSSVDNMVMWSTCKSGKLYVSSHLPIQQSRDKEHWRKLWIFVSSSTALFWHGLLDNILEMNRKYNFLPSTDIGNWWIRFTIIDSVKLVHILLSQQHSM